MDQTCLQITPWRNNTCSDAGVILALNEGRIIEQRTRKELPAEQGFHYDLYNSQFVEALVEAG